MRIFLRTLFLFSGFLFLSAHAISILPMTIPDKMKLTKNIYLSENSLRRDPSSEEARFFVKVNFANGGSAHTCAGFFVENSAGKIYVGTARHCADYEMTKACTEQSIGFLYGPHALKCLAVVAANLKDDLIILDVGMDSLQNFAEVRGSLRPLRLIDYLPKQGISFKTFGFPADYERHGLPTVTENCWDTSDSYGDFDFVTMRSTAEVGGRTGNGGARADKHFRDALQRKLRWHNCSTWGGNSGGPVVIDGTSLLAGIPAGFDAELDQDFRYRSNYSAFYESSAGFVQHNRQQLLEAGILIESR